MRMSTPYEGRPDDYGILTMSQQEIHDSVEEAHRAGWQVAIHANGDVTIDMVLNAYERVQREWPREDARHRIEHCSLVNPELLKRIALPPIFSEHGRKVMETKSRSSNLLPGVAVVDRRRRIHEPWHTCGSEAHPPPARPDRRGSRCRTSPSDIPK